MKASTAEDTCPCIFGNIASRRLGLGRHCPRNHVVRDGQVRPSRDVRE